MGPRDGGGFSGNLPPPLKWSIFLYLLQHSILRVALYDGRNKRDLLLASIIAATPNLALTLYCEKNPFKGNFHVDFSFSFANGSSAKEPQASNGWKGADCNGEYFVIKTLTFML